MGRHAGRLLAIVLGIVVFCQNLAAQEPIRFARTPDVSPDGKLLAFSYLGDVWVVEAIGGVARRVTVHEAHDFMPLFSPDGRSLAFSSNRYGGYDVFVVPVQGGRPRRLTFDSYNDVVTGWSPDGKYVLFTSRRDASYPPVAELYRVPSEGGREERISAFEGRDGSYRSDGLEIAYVRGPGTWYRKGYRGSSSDDIWICKADGTEHRQVTNSNAQDGSPCWSPDGQTLYFVSEQFGVANVCRMPVGGGTPEQITRHMEDSVRRARLSANGEWLVYECGPDLWVCRAHGDPACRKVAIEAPADDTTNPEQNVTFNGQGATEYALAPNEQYVALVIHGDVFLSPTNGGSRARRVTDHPGNDHDVAWSPDHKKLALISDRDGAENLYVAEQNDPDHPEFLRAHQFKLTQLTKGTTPISNPLFSPDGKTLAYLRDGQLWTMSADGSNAKPLVTELRVIEYSWSPDGKHLAYSRMDGHFASELYVVPAEGGESRNVTRYATRNFGASWSGDGRKLAFISQRRNDLDVFILGLQKPPREGEAPKDAAIDFDDVHLRVDRVTSMSSEESEVALKPDGSAVVFRSNALNGDDLWMASANGSQVARLTTGNVRPSQLLWAKSGTVYFLDGAGAVRAVRPGMTALAGAAARDPQGDRIPFTVKMKIDRHDTFVQMFDEGWRKLQQRFYDKDFHGADWEAVRAKYRPLIRHVALHEDYYDLVSLMLGELNASHLGIFGKARNPEEQTADLGILWDESYRGPGLRIKEVLKRGPADRRGLDLKPGAYVVAIDGVDLSEGVNLSRLLNDKVGETVALTVADDPKDAASPRRRLEIRAAHRQATADLHYQRWVEANARRVNELSKGRLGYVHVKAMDMASLDDFVRALYSDNWDKEALVLDVRYNGGGFTHDKILSYLGGREHTHFVSRDGLKGTVMRENDRKWTKPIILLCNNRSYSDAEIFPSAFRSLGLGKLVGTPTGGYVIGTTNERLIDGSTFRVPRLGVFTSAGQNMDKTGVIPDVIVEAQPEDLAKGVDKQLEVAVQTLLADVDAAKSGAAPKIAAERNGQPEAGK